MFDTHCHLNFFLFNKNWSDVIKEANIDGVVYINIPGTDIKTSRKAILISKNHPNVFASVGIHPHHVKNYLDNSSLWENDLRELEKLAQKKEVVAIGEIGLDRHQYKKTKYKAYSITEKFIFFQKKVLAKQISLSLKYKKSLILHNREASDDIIDFLNNWDKKLKGKIVFHCCEANKKLLEFAKKEKIFIGVDGDIIYSKKKREFIKVVPLELLVLETDSPYLSPLKKFPNKPKNIEIIVQEIAEIKSMSSNKVVEITTKNAKTLFNLEDN